MRKKNLSAREMKLAFVDACVRLMQEKGHDNTSLREVAKLAGFNQATVYNYFDNVDHLKFYASMRLTRGYTDALVEHTKDAKNSMDRFLLVWECFCQHAFNQPDLFQYRFYIFAGDEKNHVVDGYYQDFPEDLHSGLGSTITNMLRLTNIIDRAMVLVEDLVAEGFIREDDRIIFNEVILVLFEGMFLRLLNGRVDQETALRRTMKFILDCTRSYLQKPYDFTAYSHITF
jgi:AcrR family transcriptional regulator